MKRQRVSRACHKCRALKTKCDGQQPTCGRCVGYGFTCVWGPTKEAGHASLSKGGESSKEDPVASGQSEVIAPIVKSYEALLQSVRPKLDGTERAALDVTIRGIRAQLPSSVRLQSPKVATPPASQLLRASYQGSASEIEFLNTVRSFMSGQDLTDNTCDGDAPGYDQSDQAILVPIFERPIQLPKRKLALAYLDLYFSTIHIALPYIYRPALLNHFYSLLNGEVNEREDYPWLGLLNAVFAIGAYYLSFSQADMDDDVSSHTQYFEQSVLFSNQTTAHSTISTVWILLAQCFYLLATCHIDRCWNTLGLAVRIAQSIGLHVESMRGRDAELSEPIERELRRRTWYAIFVLDRLLAVQLGRPVAIHEEDFDVSLPSRVENLANMDAVSHSSPRQCADQAAAPSSVDYFLHVIEFSHILSQVIKELYRPAQGESYPESILLTISNIDSSLSQWKNTLPHHLRFDLGHTFENLVIFKRQRNMLAIKYHHLRALIHRPFLCLPFLQRKKGPFMELLQKNRGQIDRAERICVSEAQRTAQLLHNVTDKRSLLQDFPWWQMTPCLICASSILLVADAFCNSIEELPQTFDEDAKTCLQVFEALRKNSKAASRASEMLRSLMQLKGSGNVNRPLYQEFAGLQDITTEVGDSGPGMFSSLPAVDTASIGFSDEASIISGDELWQWPCEISNTMEWSAQFLGGATSAGAFSQPFGGAALPTSVRKPKAKLYR